MDHVSITVEKILSIWSIMSSEALSEREFELVNIVGAQLASNQRDLSRHMDLSLGAINMLLRRLVAKGYIRIEQLNKRKVKYILTPKGFAEKMRKSVRYTVKTLNSITLIKERLKILVQKFHDQGERNFFILGNSDLSLLVETAIKENYGKEIVVSHLAQLSKKPLDGMLLICKEIPGDDWAHLPQAIDVISELAQDHEFLTYSKN